MQLTGRRLAFLQHWIAHGCRDPVASARAAGYAEGRQIVSITRRLLRSASLRHYAYLLAGKHLTAALGHAFSEPPYAAPVPFEKRSAAERRARAAEIVAGANLARVDRELRRHRSAPWLNTLDMVLSRPGRGPNRLGTRKSRRTPPL